MGFLVYVQTHVKVRGHLSAVVFLFEHVVLVMELRYSDLAASILPAEPSCQPHLYVNKMDYSKKG